MMKAVFTLLFTMAALMQLEAAPPAINPQPIHEAYILRITDPIPQELITRQPPQAITETPPPQPNAQSIWISGYWSWVREKQDYVWVCGIWRVPPPDHIWLPGYWKDMKGGWTRVNGAWMPDQSKIQGPWVYSQTPPPAPQNEMTGNTPGPDYFWLPGYWDYSVAASKYQWLSGSWQKFDPEWILEGAHWIWRPEGYLFVPTYWDWRLDVRGIAYDCATKAPLDPQGIIKGLTCCYPDYIGDICYYWHYHSRIWEDCDCVPVWWGWQEWWTVPWRDQWWLWWWWIHPGFPDPPFMPIDVINIFPIPQRTIINIFGPMPQPIFITPGGVPALGQWIDALNKILGGNNDMGPFIPPGKGKILVDTVDDLFPKKTAKDQPGGKSTSPIQKPVSKESLVPASGKVSLPSIPSIKQPAAANVAPVPSHPTATPPPPSSQPVYQPPSQPAYTTPSYTPPPEYYPPSYSTPQYYPPYDYGGWDRGGYDHGGRIWDHGGGRGDHGGGRSGDHGGGRGDHGGHGDHGGGRGDHGGHGGRGHMNTISEGREQDSDRSALSSEASDGQSGAENVQ